MKTLYLHIGLPKTGTSYIQKWIELNRLLLRTAGLWTPESPDYPHRIAVEYLKDEERAARPDVVSIKRLPFDIAVQDFSQFWQNSIFKSAILSTEYFYECAPVDLINLRALAGDVDVVIVMFLRRQDRLLEAGYNQEVKLMGEVTPLIAPEYTDRHNWLKLYDEWASVFGPGKVRVVNYDEVAKSDRLLPAFCDAIDLPPEIIAASQPVVGEGHNESLPANLLEFKRLANVFGEFGLEGLLLDAVKAGIPAPAYRLPRQTANRYLSMYEASNRELARRLKLRNVDELFPIGDIMGRPEGNDFTDQLPIQTVAQLLAFFARKVSQKEAALIARLDSLEQRLDARNAGKETLEVCDLGAAIRAQSP
jgi:hypothetical protein